MKIRFTHYAIHKRLFELVNKWETAYNIKHVKHYPMPFNHQIKFREPTHLTVFVLTWSKFLEDNNCYEWQLARYIVVK